MSELYNIFPIKDAETPASVATFDGAAFGLPLADLEVAIAPMQSFNGYDRPWAAGAGKNLYNPSRAIRTAENSLVTVDGEEIHVVTTGGTAYSGMSTLDGYDFPAGTYFIKFKVKTGAVTGTGGLCGLRKRSDNIFSGSRSFSSETLEYSFSVTTTEACYFSVLGNGSSTGDSQASDFTLYDLIISTENVDYEPYSNICPITGFTWVNVYRTGKNLCYQPFPEYVNYNGTTWKNNEDGSVAVTGTPTAYAYCLVSFNLPAGTYKVSGAPNYSALGYNDILVQYPAGTTIARDYNGATESVRTFTLSSNSEGVRVLLRATTNYATGVTFYPMVTLASETSAAYEPYAGDAYSVDWTSEAGTVCAGSYEAIGGNLKVRPQYASYNGEELVGPWMSSMDAYAAGTTPTLGAQVVDLGGAETEYAIIPQSIIPIVGQNYVWANCGDINSLQYYVEPNGLVRDVCINGRSLENDGWYIKWRRLSAPKPKFDFIPIYGRDGSIDQTEALGDVFYEDRDVNVDMVYVGEDWNGAYSNLLNAVHGRSCYIQFADDPYWYWSGRLNVSEFDHKSRLLTMAGIVFPYKLNINKNEYSASVSGATEQTAVGLQLAGSRMRVSPEVIVTGNVTLKWGEMTATLSDGTYHVGGLKVGSDGVTINVWGTGSVTISYREGSL